MHVHICGRACFLITESVRIGSASWGEEVGWRRDEQMRTETDRKKEKKMLTSANLILWPSYTNIVLVLMSVWMHGRWSQMWVYGRLLMNKEKHLIYNGPMLSFKHISVKYGFHFSNYQSRCLFVSFFFTFQIFGHKELFLNRIIHK